MSPDDVTLREHFNVVIGGMKENLELQLGGLKTSVETAQAQTSREHLEVRTELASVRSGLESLRDDHISLRTDVVTLQAAGVTTSKLRAADWARVGVITAVLSLLLTAAHPLG